ncbi:hypothetical protein LZ30DRAFT_60769 [Colletotrichum cereale]|nr:hypothetical protein LZ30DRAFT_60769 [Colletotrichum cereale]
MLLLVAPCSTHVQIQYRRSARDLFWSKDEPNLIGNLGILPNPTTTSAHHIPSSLAQSPIRTHTPVPLRWCHIPWHPPPPLPLSLCCLPIRPTHPWPALIQCHVIPKVPTTAYWATRSCLPPRHDERRRHWLFPGPPIPRTPSLTSFQQPKLSFITPSRPYSGRFPVTSLRYACACKDTSRPKQHPDAGTSLRGFML